MRTEDREKFVRLATKRVSNALKAIQLIGNLSNKSNYDYTEEDVQKIFKALAEELHSCRKKFELAQKRQSRVQFSFD
jgi:RNA recognition motif-containing protein